MKTRNGFSHLTEQKQIGLATNKQNDLNGFHYFIKQHA